MKLNKYLDRGLASVLAKRLRVSPVLISQWSNGVRRVPAERCVEIEKATAGAVRCEDLRPDIDWAFLRRAAPQADINRDVA